MPCWSVIVLSAESGCIMYPMGGCAEAGQRLREAAATLPDPRLSRQGALTHYRSQTHISWPDSRLTPCHRGPCRRTAEVAHVHSSAPVLQQSQTGVLPSPGPEHACRALHACTSLQAGLTILSKLQLCQKIVNLRKPLPPSARNVAGPVHAVEVSRVYLQTVPRSPSPLKKDSRIVDALAAFQDSPQVH